MSRGGDSGRSMFCNSSSGLVLSQALILDFVCVFVCVSVVSLLHFVTFLLHLCCVYAVSLLVMFCFCCVFVVFLLCVCLCLSVCLVMYFCCVFVVFFFNNHCVLLRVLLCVLLLFWRVFVL